MIPIKSTPDVFPACLLPFPRWKATNGLRLRHKPYLYQLYIQQRFTACPSFWYQICSKKRNKVCIYWTKVRKKLRFSDSVLCSDKVVQIVGASLAALWFTLTACCTAPLSVQFFTYGWAISGLQVQVWFAPGLHCWLVNFHGFQKPKSVSIDHAFRSNVVHAIDMLLFCC